MARVLVREIFTSEDMPKMTITIRAAYFRSTSIAVGNLFYCICDFLIKTWPTTTGVEFRIRCVQFCIAPAADVGALTEFTIVLARKRSLCSSILDDVPLFRCQIVPHGHVKILAFLC